MTASPKNIWRVPAYLSYLQPPLTDKLLKTAERKLGYQLPASLVKLLREQNGGYIRYTLPDICHSQIYGIGPHFPSLTEVDWSECQEMVSFPLKGLIPFDGDGHWYLCLDYRGDGKVPAVTYVDVECDRESDIAPSFDHYLSLLELNIEKSDLVMLGVTDLPAVLAGLSTRLKLQFEPPDTYDHGYPVYRAGGITKKNVPEWIWISPNIVPRGFARPDEPRFKALRNIMPGEAPRYPELPKFSYLLSVTDGLQSKVLRACKDLSIDVRPLADCVK